MFRYTNISNEQKKVPIFNQNLLTIFREVQLVVPHEVIFDSEHPSGSLKTKRRF